MDTRGYEKNRRVPA